MSFVVTALWRAKLGEEEHIAALLPAVAAASEAEPGCLLFWVHRSIEDPARFFLYEQYTDRAAFDAHAASDHVRRYVLEDAVNRLELRERHLYETLGGTAERA